MNPQPPDPPNHNPYASSPAPPSPPPAMGDDAGIRLLLPVGRSGWAIAAGYLGLFALIIVPAPLAFIVSIIAIFDINRSKKSGKPKYGMGRAIFGLIAGTFGTLLLLYAFLQR